MNKRVINWIVTVIVISVLFYLFFVLFTGAGAVFGALESLRLAWIPPILGLVFLAYLIRGFRWNFYLREIGVRVGQGEGQWLYFSGLSMLITPMMLSGAIKVGLVKARLGAPISTTFPIVIAERLTDLIGMLALMLIAGVVLSLFNANAYYIGTTVFVVGFLAVFIGVMRSKSLCQRGVAWLGRGRLRRRIQEPMANAYASIYSLLSPRALAVAGGIGFVSWAVQWLAFYLILRGFDIEIGMLETMFIFAFPTILGVVSQLPGGIGAEEGGMLALMVLAGQESGVSVAAILMYRILTLWFGLLLGVVALKYYSVKYIGGDVDVCAANGQAEVKP